MTSMVGGGAEGRGREDGDMAEQTANAWSATLELADLLRWKLSPKAKVV